MEGKIGVWIFILALSIIAIITHELIPFFPLHLLIISVIAIVVFTLYRIYMEKKVDMESAVSFLMATVGALTYILGLHIEGNLVLALFALAELLEEYAERLSEESLRALIKYLPRKARIDRGRSVAEVSIDAVKPGDMVIVGRGDRIPVDGVVVEGVGEVDQSIVTGEYIPVTVRKGSYVYAGSLLLNGALKVKAVASGEESLVTRLVKLVEKYKERKASVEKTVYRFAKIYLPLMLVVAAASWFLLEPQVALVIIAISCPSAFLISITSTLLYAVSLLSRNGILSKGTTPIEKASKIRVVALDKTGTITLGLPKVSRVLAFNGFTEDEVLRVAASIEVASSHPLARAIVKMAEEKGLGLLEFSGVKEVPGAGIVGKVDGMEVRVGSEKIIGKTEETLPQASSPRVYVSINGVLAGLILFEEEYSPSSAKAIRKLRQMGVNVALLTGDKRDNAARIARLLEIEEYHAELSPQEKVMILESLRRRYGNVAMVGDGVNDAPALAAADLGIAVGSLEAAIEAGDVALTSHNLEKLPFLLSFSRKIYTTVLMNLGIVATIKTIIVVLAATGTLPLWAAVAVGDDGSLLAAFINTIVLARLFTRA